MLCLFFLTYCSNLVSYSLFSFLIGCSTNTTQSWSDFSIFLLKSSPTTLSANVVSGISSDSKKFLILLLLSLFYKWLNRLRSYRFGYWEAFLENKPLFWKHSLILVLYHLDSFLWDKVSLLLTCKSHLLYSLQFVLDLSNIYL